MTARVTLAVFLVLGSFLNAFIVAVVFSRAIESGNRLLYVLSMFYLTSAVSQLIASRYLGW